MRLLPIIPTPPGHPSFETRGNPWPRFQDLGMRLEAMDLQRSMMPVIRPLPQQGCRLEAATESDFHDP